MGRKHVLATGNLLQISIAQRRRRWNSVHYTLSDNNAPVPMWRSSNMWAEEGRCVRDPA